MSNKLIVEKETEDNDKNELECCINNKIQSIENNEKINIENSVRELRKRFFAIKNIGYVPSVRKGSTGIGATFESLLGKNEDKLEIPDFMGIEIKTKRGYSKSQITLFNAAPIGTTECETKRLRDKYGYPDKRDKNLKKFSGKIRVGEITKIGLFYRFQLEIDRERKRIVLCVYDWNEVCIDESAYWEFSVLKEKLIRKLSVLALVKAWPNNINGVEHFKYYKMTIYLLKDFESFLDALEAGKIKVSFKIGNHYEEDRYGEVEAHGVGFSISEEDLDSIFDYYR